MGLTAHQKDKFKYLTVSLIVVVVIASAFFSWQQAKTAGDSIKQRLSERSQGIAAALGPSQIAKLTGTSDDGGTPAYVGLKKQLAQVKAASPDVRSVYLMGRDDGHLFFYVDSEQPDSSQYSSAGEHYNDGTPEDNAIFDSGQAFVEGPATDSYGTFFSGLAPIYKPGTKQVLAVLGNDVDASAYTRQVLVAAAGPMVTGLSVVLIIIIFEIVRQRNLRLLDVRSELVSVASHELSNPISGIRWAAQHLQKELHGQPTARLADAIYSSTVQIQSGTEDLLTLSRALSQTKPTIVPTNLTKLLEEVIQTQALAAEQKGVVVAMTPSWPLELQVDCDASQIKRAMQNIVSNAVKYTKPRSYVTISYKDGGKTHDIQITDQGIGIPDKEQSKIWQGFYRASNVEKGAVPGRGLGLYLVKAVFERHGGSVGFVSIENQGTTFTLRLPKHR